MKISLLTLTVLTAGLTYGQEFSSWQSSPPADMATFHANLAAPPVDQSGDNSISTPPVVQSLNSRGSAAQSLSAVGNDADKITPEIQTLAKNLRNDVLAIHRYVTHNIEFEAYYGCKRGANLTLLEKRGNAHDQCALLVALLRAAGHEANYIIGPAAFSYTILQDVLGFPNFPLPEQTDTQILALFGGSLPSGFTYLQARQYLNTFNFLNPRGYPIVSYTNGDTFVFDHVWAEVIVGSDNYLLNPSIKRSFSGQPIDILGNSGYSTAAFLAAAGGTAGTGSIGNASIKTINESAINAQLTSLTTTFSAWLRNNRPNISTTNLLGKRSIFPRSIPNLQTLLPNNIINTSWASAARHSEIPESEMSRFELRMGDYDFGAKSYNNVYHTETILMPSLCGQKLSLTFSGNNATFKLDENVLHTESLPSGNDGFDMDMAAIHDHFRWVWNGSSYVKTAIGRNNDFSSTQKYLKDDSYAYAIPYGFKPSGELLRKRQAVLDKYLRAGLTNSSDEVRTEVLNIIGLAWMRETSLADDLIVANEDIDLAFLHRIGRVAQEEFYYIDFFMQYLSGQSRSSRSNIFLTLLTSSFFHSSYEHAVIERLQAGNIGAISTIKLIHLANQTGTELYRVNSSNWQAGPNIRNLVTGYTAGELAAIDDTVNAAGGEALLPHSGDIQLGDWDGAGFILRRPASVAMVISGGLSGGYNSVVGQVEFLPLVDQGRSDPSYWENGTSTQNVGYTPNFLERYLGADPVDMATGAFVMEKSELELGQAMPRGLRFTRYFNSNRRYDTSPGLGGGWTYNLYGKAFDRTSTKGSLGLTTARHVIPSLIAMAVTRDLVDNDSGSAKNQVVSALIAQWASDQITDNAVGIVLGEKTLEFVKMPDGTYEPPPGSTLSLIKNGSNKFELTERNASTIIFGTDGWIESITDPHGNQTIFTYSGDKLSTVTDAYGRTLTFTWSGDQITEVADSTAREIGFGYSAAGDLETVTDVEGKTWSYTYTADHQIETVLDPQNRVITQNTYDVLGRVSEQNSMGDANKLWKIYYTGSVTQEQDPEGNITTYHFDKRGRAIGSTNQLGHNETRIYDGEDHLTFTINENLETSTYNYDVDHNLLSATDAANHTTSYFYDAQHRLERIRDKEGNDTYFTFTATNLVQTVTDQLGYVTAYGYYPDGLVHTVTDAESKTTTTAYDVWGNINRITLHDTTFHTLTNNARGDIIISTDAEGRTITNTWNERRQILTTQAPAIPGQPAATITNSYDNSGKLASSEDANGNQSAYIWNALGKPTISMLPALASGANTVTTTYNSQDWIEKTTNSLSQVMRREYDAAHRMTAIIDPLNRRTENTYDPKGQMLTSTDPLSRIEETDWTVRGEMDVQTDAEGKDTLFVYDKNGNRITLADRRGKIHTFAYDNANRLISTITPGGKTTSMTYFDNNFVKTIQEPSGQTTTHAYNDRNLISSKSDPAGSIGYIYDDSGLLLTVSEGTDTITRAFDERGRVETYTNEDGDTLKYQYDGHGNLTRLTYPDGRHVYYTYNARNLLKTVTDWSSRITSYQYDRLGRLREITRPNNTSATIDRDAANQILSIRESANGKLFSLLQFDYDIAGQVASRFRAPIAQSAFQQPSFTGTYDDDNRLLTVNGGGVTHDDDGNMTLGPIGVNSGNTTLSYNSRNQLTGAGGITYTYDAEGHRRTLADSHGTTRFTIDATANMSRMLVRSVPDGTKTYYIYGIGLLYEADETDNTKTYHFDQVGSSIARTDDSGQIIGRAEYSPYGLVAMLTGDMGTPFLYNGQWGIQTDGNGLLNMRARYYSPYLMRFLNADPIGFSGGSNWFAYADGDPISTLDPFGLWSWRNTLSLALDFVPIVSTVKAAVEAATGYDIIAAEDVNRGVAAAGIAASFIPGGRAALKGGSALTEQAIRHGDEVADAAALAARHGDEAPVRVTQFFDETRAFPVDGSRALRTRRQGFEVIDGIPAEGATWVVPRSADNIGDFAHLMTGRGNRSAFAEFDALPSELVNSSFKRWQTYIPGSVDLAGRNAVIGNRGGNVLDAMFRQSGFYNGTIQSSNRIK